MWQKTSFSNMTHNFSYYDEYVAPINILQLGSTPLYKRETNELMVLDYGNAYPTKKVGELSYGVRRVMYRHLNLLTDIG